MTSPGRLQDQPQSVRMLSGQGMVQWVLHGDGSVKFNGSEGMVKMAGLMVASRVE